MHDGGARCGLVARGSLSMGAYASRSHCWRWRSNERRGTTERQTYHYSSGLNSFRCSRSTASTPT